MMRDINKCFEKKGEQYYKPVTVVNFYSKNYIK